MTRKHATRIVMDAALQYCAGAGQGLRTVPSEHERRDIVEAARVLWPTIYNGELTQDALYNRGVNLPIEPEGQ